MGIFAKAKQGVADAIDRFTEFNAIREAYAVLADPEKRRRYLES